MKSSALFALSPIPEKRAPTPFPATWSSYQNLLKNRNKLLWKRIIAFTIDLFFITWLTFNLQQAFVGFWEDYAAFISPALLRRVTKEFILFGVCLRYSVWVAYMTMATYVTGTSLGKYLCGLKVISNDGKELAFWQCFNRSLTYPLYWFFLPVVIPFLNDAGKSLGDFAGQTYVVAAQEAPASALQLVANSADTTAQRPAA